MPYKDPLKQKEYNKQYQQKHHQKYYQQNKQTIRMMSAYYRKKNILLYFQEKLKYKCIKCDEDNICCLEFHHTNPNEKEKAVSELLSCSFQRIKEEMDKCVVLCSNCHKKEHWDENKINQLKIDIVELEKKIHVRQKKQQDRRGCCRGCGSSREQKEFIAGRCFCKDCYKIYQKNKMQERRKYI